MQYSDSATQFRYLVEKVKRPTLDVKVVVFKSNKNVLLISFRSIRSCYGYQTKTV